MSQIAISIQQVSKLFQMGGSGSLRETLTNGVKNLFGRQTKKEEFWALKEVSLDIQQGDVMGIVGRNGAGKSTLLKILSRISEPTSGKIDLYGRITSLLEVGTGFHPELTGRENIYLNGSILGMTRSEIKRKFEEIVAFSGVEKFLDTAVKHYSSGMYVRLAFAVAAHLDAEILVIDEVLAVGDAEFQRKCLGKMNEIAKGGRTVIFVSHNMGAVRSLCNTCCLLQQGRLTNVGLPDEIIQAYFFSNMDEKASYQRSISDWKNKNLPIRPTGLAVVVNGEINGFMQVGDELAFEVDFEADKLIEQIYLSVVISSTTFGDVIHSSTYFLPEFRFEPCRAGKVRIKFDRPPLMAGQYTAAFWVGESQFNFEVLFEALTFEVQEKNVWGTVNNPPRVSPLWWNTPFELLESR